MKKVLSLALCLALLLSSMLALTSCGDKDHGAEINTYYCGEVYDFDPTRQFTNDNAAKLISLLFEPLFTLNADGSVSNALAESYRVVENPEEDSYKMIINLRETYWSSSTGARVSADDVVFAWLRILDPEFQTQAAPLLYEIKNAVAYKQAEVTQADVGIYSDGFQELTIEFEGKIDYDAFIRNLTSVALSPLRESDVKRADGYWGMLVGTFNCNGPFTLRAVEHTTNKENATFVLVRNQNYRRSPDSTGSVKQYVNPYSLEIVWRASNAPPDRVLNAVLDEFLENTVFYVGEIPVSRREEVADKVVVNDLNSTYSYIFNSEKEFSVPDRDANGKIQKDEKGNTITKSVKLFDDYRVRLALSMVIDRAAIAQQLVYAKPATGLLPYTVKEGNSNESFRVQGGDIISTSANLTAAQELLAQTGIVPGDFKFAVTCNSNNEESAITDAVVAAWNALGFKVEKKMVSTNTFHVEAEDRDIQDSALQQAYESRAFDVIGIDYQAYSTNAFVALCNFSSTMSGNGVKWLYEGTANVGKEIRTHASGFADSYYDFLIEAAFACKDNDERSALLHQAEVYLMTSMPICPIVFNQSAYVASGDLSGLQVNGYGITMMQSVSLKNYELYLEENQTKGKSDDE